MSDDVRDKDRPQHRELCPLLFLKSCVGSLTSHRVICKQGLWDGTYGLSSLSKKTRKSNHLPMSLQRQHFLLRYFKNPSVGRPGFELTTSPSADQHSPNWAKQAANEKTMRMKSYMYTKSYVYLPVRKVYLSIWTERTILEPNSHTMYHRRSIFYSLPSHLQIFLMLSQRTHNHRPHHHLAFQVFLLMSHPLVF